MANKQLVCRVLRAHGSRSVAHPEVPFHQVDIRHAVQHACGEYGIGGGAF
jgi:hypothetical protein